MDKKILVVDDEKAVRNLLHQAFSRAGFTVTTAESAERALELLDHEHVFVMFFDLDLPGMNGIELCTQVKKNIPVSVIYAVTGYASVFELTECIEAGFEDYFKKPVNISTLINKADSAFEKIERWKKM